MLIIIELSLVLQCWDDMDSRCFDKCTVNTIVTINILDIIFLQIMRKEAFFYVVVS